MKNINHFWRYWFRPSLRLISQYLFIKNCYIGQLSDKSWSIYFQILLYCMLLMQLKLSSLVIIIAILLLYYYYFTQPVEKYTSDYVPYQPPPVGDTGLTPLQHTQEPFGVTPIDFTSQLQPQYTPLPNTSVQNDYSEYSQVNSEYAYISQPRETYSLAGNVRPDQKWSDNP